MIPLSDASRRPKRFPVATLVIILLNAFVFMLELNGGEAFVKQWSVIPADVVAGKNWVTILTAMFMHGGWMHIIGNLVFLKAFGPEMEDAMGRIGYSAFYVLSGVAASVAQILAMPESNVPNLESNVPNLGASGAIAGVMGAFLITYPHDRIRTLFFFGIFTRITLIPAALLIGIWFLIQLFSEIGAAADVQAGGVAYMAHLGGFIFGAVCARLFESSPRTPELEI
ncbi:MAG: rhomboid family intramembrane serine protease [Acidobacteria bacterium]|nr:MAG: rhomboid family intramembrane serine protease [Acidobacteriota bacterium]